VVAPPAGYVVFIIIISSFQELKAQSGTVNSFPSVLSTYRLITSIQRYHILELIPFSHKFFIMVYLQCVFVIPCYFQPHALNIVSTCLFHIFSSVFLKKFCPLCPHLLLLLRGLHLFFMPFVLLSVQTLITH